MRWRGGFGAKKKGREPTASLIRVFCSSGSLLKSSLAGMVYCIARPEDAIVGGLLVGIATGNGGRIQLREYRRRECEVGRRTPEYIQRYNWACHRSCIVGECNNRDAKRSEGEEIWRITRMSLLRIVGFKCRVAGCGRPSVYQVPECIDVRNRSRVYPCPLYASARAACRVPNSGPRRGSGAWLVKLCLRWTH